MKKPIWTKSRLIWNHISTGIQVHIVRLCYSAGSVSITAHDLHEHDEIQISGKYELKMAISHWHLKQSVIFISLVQISPAMRICPWIKQGIFFYFLIFFTPGTAHKTIKLLWYCPKMLDQWKLPERQRIMLMTHKQDSKVSHRGYENEIASLKEIAIHKNSCPISNFSVGDCEGGSRAEDR